MPHLGLVDLVPQRERLGAREEVVDGGAGGAVGRAGEVVRVAEGLVEEALFGRWLEGEEGDDFGGGEGVPWEGVAGLVVLFEGGRDVEVGEGEGEEETREEHFG